MEFSRQEYWSALPFSSPGDLPNPGIEPGSLALQADSLPSEPQASLTTHVWEAKAVRRGEWAALHEAVGFSRAARTERKRQWYYPYLKGEEELWGGAAWMVPSAQGTSLQLIFKCLREWLTAGVQNFKGKASRRLDCLWEVTLRVVLTTPGHTARSGQLTGASEGNAFSYMGKGDTDDYIHNHQS